jgi:hypothetical protein
MNNPARLHLVEPQPLLRSRLVQSLEAAGVVVTFGNPLDAVADESVVVLNLDGPSAQWELDASRLVREFALRTIVTSASSERLATVGPSDVLGAMLRPFSTDELLDFVTSRLGAPPSTAPDSRLASVAELSDERDVAVTASPSFWGDDLATLDTEAVGSLPERARAASDSVTEVELVAVHPLRDMIISAYVDTLAEMLPTLSRRDGDDTRAALRALLVRFADELV